MRTPSVVWSLQLLRYVLSVPLTPSAPRLRYETTGPEAAPRVLLVMGYGMRGRVWQPQIDGLGEDHRLAWFDARGIGDSDRPPGPWSMADMARDASRVLDALGWNERVHLVGVSMGGMVAQHLALAEPERLSTLTLIATTPGGVLSKLPTLRGIYYFARANLASQATRRDVLVKLLYPDAFVRSTDPEALARRMEQQMGVRASPSTLRAQLAAVTLHDVRSRLAEIELPTLVVRPGRDLLMRPTNSDRLARDIPNARLLELPEAGHGVVFQCSDEVNRALREHFRRP